MAHSFSPSQPLHALIEPYVHLPRHSCQVTREFLQHLPASLTFLIFCQGHVTKNETSHKLPPLFVWNTQGQGQTFAYTTPPGEDVMLTRAHYDYLSQHHGFELEAVSAILFYKTDATLPRVFKQLTLKRQAAATAGGPAHSTNQVQIIKSIINFACGYFGYNALKKKNHTKWLVSGFTRYTGNICKYIFEDAGEFDYREYNIRTLVKHHNGALITPLSLKASNTALPLFCIIIDVGKVRLAQCLDFIYTVARPGSVKLLYTHIDNLILATSSPDTLQHIVPVSQQDYFSKHYATFFASPNTAPQPGQLKCEFHVTTGQWQFASPHACFYTLVNDQDHAQDNVCKTASLNHLSHETAFRCAVDLLDKKAVTVVQQRRINKLSHLNTHQVVLQLKGK